jgi:mevalonate pyrophosphate decarboxylase
VADLCYLFKRNGDFQTVFALSKTNELSSRALTYTLSSGIRIFVEIFEIILEFVGDDQWGTILFLTMLTG